MCRHIAERVVT